MNFHQISGQIPQENSATQIAYTRLRDLIITGELAPGEKLKIDGLKDTLGMGASPIREALSQLTADQLVIRQDQRGFRAAEASRENFQEILELRCTLEGNALRKSMQNSQENWLEELVLSHHRMARAKSDGADVFEQKHKTFHMTLIGNCNSPLLLRFCSQLYDLNIRYRHIAGGTTGYGGRDVDNEHKQILDAILQADIDQAVDLLTSHYETTGAFLSARIE